MGRKESNQTKPMCPSGCSYFCQSGTQCPGPEKSMCHLSNFVSFRLNPQNGHQLPTIVVLCGPHIQGAQGLNCARHLVNHGVKTLVFLPNFIRMVQSVEQELKLFEMCGGKRYSNAQGRYKVIEIVDYHTPNPLFLPSLPPPPVYASIKI